MTPNTTEFGDCREIMRRWATDGVKIQTCVTSPPYFGLRDYGVAGQLGAEKTPDEYVAAMVETFRAVRDVLADDGTLWLNLGDSYAGSWGAQSRGNTTGEAKSKLEGSSMLSARQIISHPLGQSGTGSLKNTPGLKNKDLIGIPWRVAFALQADGWYLRQDIIWVKPNPMPESVRDRCTKAHEYLFLLSRSPNYYCDMDAIRQPYAEKTKTAWGCEFKGRGDGSGLIGAEKLGRHRRNAQTARKGRESALGVELLHEAIQRRPLRDLPPGPNRTVHPGRQPTGRHRSRPLHGLRNDSRCRLETRTAVSRL